MATATIKIFLVHGDPKRLRTAELSNWTGKAVAGPRSEFDGLLAREESKQSGVYFLTGSDPESGKAAIYIGEAEIIRDRIKSHLDKDFWNQVVYFISKDENLTKAHIRYLEGKLIEKARGAGRALVTNGQTSGARLPESDREDMEVFYEKINQLLPVLGVELLVPLATAPPGALGKEELVCEVKGVRARGHRIANGFLVLKGSQAVLHERPSSEKYPWAHNMRKELKNDGVLAQEQDHLLFTKRRRVFESECGRCGRTRWPCERAYRVEEWPRQDVEGNRVCMTAAMRSLASYWVRPTPASTEARDRVLT